MLLAITVAEFSFKLVAVAVAAQVSLVMVYLAAAEAAQGCQVLIVSLFFPAVARLRVDIPLAPVPALSIVGAPIRPELAPILAAEAARGRNNIIRALERFFGRAVMVAKVRFELFGPAQLVNSRTLT